MSEVTTDVDAQVAEGTQQSQADATANESQAESNSETISLDEAKKLRSEARNLRSRLTAAESEVNKFKTSQLSETEKTKKTLEDLQADNGKKTETIQTLLLRNRTEELGKQMGARTTKSLVRLIDRENLEFDLDTLEVKGLEEELKRLKKDDPDLFVSGGTEGGAGNGSRAGATQTMNDLMRKSMR